MQIYKDFFIRAIFFVENAVFSHGSFIFRFDSSLCFRELDAMGRMRETSLQELADTKNTDSPTLLWLGGIRNFCTISVKLHFRRIREIRVQKSFSA